MNREGKSLKVLAFDYGASSGRAILGKFDGERLTLEEIHRFSNDPVQAGAGLHWDILRLYHEMRQGILRYKQKGESDLAGMAIDTWGVDFGLLTASGELLGNPYHYRDSRTDGMIEAACKRVSKTEIYRETGIQFLKFNTLYQLLALKLNDSPLLAQAETLLFIPDLLAFFLTGEKRSEYTIASTSQMLNPTTGDWARMLLDKLAIPQSILAELVEPGAVIGRIKPDLAADLGIPGFPVIAAAEHDTASAVVAVPAEVTDFAYLSSGTWSLMGVELPAPQINDTTFRLDYTNEGGIDRTTRLLKNIMGLWIFQECKREWDQPGTVTGFGELLGEAATAEPFGCLIDPDAEPFGSPGRMTEKIRNFCRETGQKLPGTRGEVVRCIMESLAMKYRMALEGLEEITGHPISVLHVVGGGSQNEMLNQFTANATNKPVLAGPVEATAIGNLAVQL
ncbi:MAG TPA: rhamnulokinase family protein, partial [Bacillota bacterium]